MKLADVRRVIARDQLPEVPGSFQFRMDEMAVITEAQEGTWDAEVFTGDSVCILVPQKGNKGERSAVCLSVRLSVLFCSVCLAIYLLQIAMF
jgi:hypothetical protein